MKQVLRRLAGLLGASDADHPGINIIKSRKEILKAIHESKDSGNVLGVYCPSLGEGMLLIGVENISTYEGEVIVSLKRYDLNGILLHRNSISVTEIRSVCPFSTMYVNPFLKAQKVYA